MRRTALAAAAALFAAATLAACGLVTSTSRSVFVLFDVSGTYTKAVPDAAKLANLMIAELQPGDWIGAGQISSCSFSEEEIILQQRLPETPSLASSAKRDLFAALATYAQGVKPTKFTDIRGALAQAVFELRQRPEQARYIVIFSDMVQDLQPGCDTSGVNLDLSGVTVIAANVIKTTPGDPDKYFALLADWEKTITEAGGTWKMVTSPDQLPELVMQ
jgi:hypothetical protein